MSFVEIMKLFDRICYFERGTCFYDSCPIAKLIGEWEEENGTWSGPCIEFAVGYPKEFENAVLSYEMPERNDEDLTSW